MKRREFLKVSSAASGALVIGVNLSGCASSPRARMIDLANSTGEFSPNAFIKITPDNRIIYTMDKSEMGQGVATSHPMMVAEELEVKLEQIELDLGGARDEFRTSPGGMQITGGSTSVVEAYKPLRLAAATAREMLIAAAAAKWGVSASECVAQDATIKHTKSDKTLTYGELTREAALQSIPEPELKTRDQFKILGKPTQRVDAYAKSTGTANFGIDVQIEGMLKAFIIRPPVLGQKVRSFDAKKAREMKGVVDVFDFESGVAILAEKYWQARRAAPTVSVEWEDTPLQRFSSKRLREVSAERALERGLSVREDGDVDRALEREGVTKIEAVYQTPYLAHAPMEPQNCTAQVSEDGVEIWAPTQAQSLAQDVAAAITGFDREQVKVHTTYLGGGFGRRGLADFVAEAVRVAMRTERPVQVIWTREDDTQGGFYRPSTYNQMYGAVDAKGDAVAWSHHVVTQSIIAQESLLGPMTQGMFPRALQSMLTKSSLGLFRSGSVPGILAAEGARELPYAIENLRLDYTPVNTDVTVSFWRSVGHSNNGFVVESFIDEMAHAAKKDPFEFRRRLLEEHPRHKHVLEVAAEKGNWGKPTKDGFARGIAQHHSFGSYAAQVVETGVVNGKIKLERVVCVIDCGLALNPDIVKAQMESAIIYGLSAALFQEITFDRGVVQQGNFNKFRSLRMYETPEIEVYIVDSKEDPSGAGEPGLPPAAPALANAIFAATGIRLREMPLQRALNQHTSRGG